MILIIEGEEWLMLRTSQGDVLAEGDGLSGWDVGEILKKLGHEVKYSYDRDFVRPPKD